MDIKARILVVDDNCDLCENIKDILKDSGYLAECALNGKEAIKLAGNSKYDIAIIDINLPDISGNEVVEKIAEFAPSMDFIYMTGHATINSAIEAVKQKHVVSYETKPLDLDHLLTLINQVVERKKADEALELFRVLINQTTDAVFMKDVSGRYVMINSAGAKIIGKPVSEIIGKDDTQLFPYDVARKLIEMDQEIMASERGKVFDEKISENGNIRDLHTAKEPYRDTSGTIIGVIGVSRDITEHKKMEEMLLQSEKLKSLGIITAGIAHEFNNILAIMLGSAELLESGFKDNKELKKGLDAIIRAGDDGAGIVKNMLTFAKSGGEDVLDYVFFDIRCLINEAIEFATPRWKSMAQAKGIDYKIDKEGMREIPEILCNTTELREVFTNIINNALDAMPNGGTLSFRTWSNEDTVFISISDTGKGMPEDVKEKIFDPFFTTRRPLGTGLGLSVSYGVIMRHGGRVEVDTEEGKGTTFNLSIPIKNDTAQQKLSVKPLAQEIMANKLRVLVVDDSEEMCVILDSLLTTGGHNVKTVNDGAKAIELAGKEDFDLVLCDLAMPNVYGYDVVKAINKLGKRPKIGIMTGWDEKLKAIDDEEFKVDFYLKKPFGHSVLIKHINELFI